MVLACIDTQRPIVLENAHQAAAGYSEDRSQVDLVASEVGGQSVFLPATLVLTAGAGRSIHLVNTTGKPHGVRIPGLGVEVLVPPGGETVTELPPLEAGRVYAVACPVDEAHSRASLVVVPAR